ncbi:hypothetical protein CDL15_Pgr012683 [Punica granatum]|uniref:Uncharacterized protein n=1 Tax=Punica granatum TaxID=22663 RepID=A0A218XU08_PUNGR|nr:hypothetical protein CDL15_Pgr012683 [Punica granatum]
MEKQSIHGDNNKLRDKLAEEVRGVGFGKYKKEGGLTPPTRKSVKWMVIKKIADVVVSSYNNADNANDAEMETGRERI